MARPWGITSDNWDRCMDYLFPIWLKERGGIAVYENHVLDSSQLGHKTFMPKRYIATDNQLHDAPPRIGDVPSRFEERVDIVTLEEFDGDVDKALACFTKEA